MRLIFEQVPGQPRRYRQGNQQRQQHPQRGVDRDRAHVWPHQAADKRHRQQGRNDREGGQNSWPPDFIDSPWYSGFQRFPHTEVAVDVFHHDDGVIDQNTDGKYQRKQGYPVEGEAPGPGSKQRHRQGQYHGTADHYRFTAAKGEQHQCDNRQGGKNQLMDQLVRFVVGGFAVVAGNFHIQVRRQPLFFQGIETLQHPICDHHGIFAGFFGDGQGNGWFGLLTPVTGPDIIARRGGTYLHLRYLRQAHRLAVNNGNDEVFQR